MAVTTNVNKTVHPGANDRVPEHRLVTVTGTAGDIADNATYSIPVPELVGVAGMATVVKAWSYGAGAVGARVATNLPIIDTGSALIGIEETSFTEATGTLVITNRTGAAITNLQLLLAIFPDVRPGT